MASLKEVRNRIHSVRSSQQLTSAMKLVAAAKLKKAQDAILRMRPYAEKMQEIISNLSSSLTEGEGIYGKERQVKNVLLVAVTSNRGLCGSFNSQIIKKSLSLIGEEFGGNAVRILSVGKKGNDYIRKTPYVLKDAVLGTDIHKVFDNLSYNNSCAITERLMHLFADTSYDRICLVYNKFRNAASQVLAVEQFLPILPPEKKGTGITQGRATADYILEPGRDEIVKALIPRALKTQFYKTLLDSFASEHGARMTAMHKATDNAGEILKELKLSYNKARQAAITKEILEIVGGVEALKN